MTELRQRCSQWTTLMTLLMGMVAAYPLSIGPVVSCNEALQLLHTSWLSLFYAPVLWLARSNLFCYRVYLWYMDLCGADSLWFAGIQA